ncbi:MAG TPA: hypothetical protein VFO55_13285 [Gemmatimonadaceae bacterium]|nr:hypothetical protein [Gemmatimonadaceae bacterium]
MASVTTILSRRAFIGTAGSLALAAALRHRVVTQELPNARLSARPRRPSQRWKVGTTKLWEGKSSAYLHVPQSYTPSKPISLLIALHGAGGRSNGPLRLWTPHADDAGFALLVPESTGTTWDAIRGLYSDDVGTIDRALDMTFDRLAVDPGRITLAGFSDGASYSLGLGLMNADLFPRLMANSPGFITRYARQRPGPRPAVFVSHGRRDPILPFDNAVGRVVPQLRAEGCEVDFREFDGGHTVPVSILREAVKFVTG